MQPSRGGCALFLTWRQNTVFMTEEMPDPEATFATTLSHFEMSARKAKRGFKVAMAVNVFGVGTLLPNDLPKTAEVQKNR
ncbi:hypothetical protein M2401_002817 [Pseudomonas sp. JUb42]|jgi:hypothetical protein|uniref:hypothetical protein n=1 Tax=Pseudomonas sp. JUb42 TaxID=2940611 RepID=UPI0021682213|nr:hypothetical protein [Pseudomonas sp. JUb42]MCS3469079.1 hypothetical protein [Pseudomonas sp. JUb42]